MCYRLCLRTWDSVKKIIKQKTIKMRVVALISGGKDSCYNMLQCVAAGHEICALANLRPESKGKYFMH